MPDILEEALTVGGLPASAFELRLRGSFRPVDHVCQYRESDLDFISRWMEREGLYYFFDHEGDEEKLVTVNDSGEHTALGDGPIRFFATGSGDSTLPARRWRPSPRATPARPPAARSPTTTLPGALVACSRRGRRREQRPQRGRALVTQRATSTDATPLRAPPGRGMLALQTPYRLGDRSTRPSSALDEHPIGHQPRGLRASPSSTVAAR
ncbi:MAG: contractile injection system protein, VgrG/Pvc8 family [Polyangiales bacterium]